MKAIALPIIAGAFSLYGSAFFEVWTAPGLEGLPTYKVVLDQLPSARAAESESESEPGGAIVPISSAAQFLPWGVVAPWGGVPVIKLPDRTEAQEKLKKEGSGLASTPASPKPVAVPQRVVTAPKPKAPQPVVQQPNRSYRLKGHSVRYQNNQAAGQVGSSRLVSAPGNNFASRQNMGTRRVGSLPGNGFRSAGTTGMRRVGSSPRAFPR